MEKRLTRDTKNQKIAGVCAKFPVSEVAVGDN